MAKLRRLALVFLANFCGIWAAPALADALVGGLPVQGVLRTNAGGAVADGTYTLKVSLYDQAVGGAVIWQETYGAVAVVGGLFAFEIGSNAGGTPLPAVLTTTATPLWFGIAVSQDPELPRTAIGWVPRAYWANVAGTAQSLGCSGCISADHIATGAIGADKVSFPYAGSASAGGPATSALTATKADSATTAGTAASATTATTAASASTAASADVAKDVKCTACVSLAEMAQDAVSAFLPIGGGTVTGSLTVNNTLFVGKVLDLTNAVIFGGAFGPGGLTCDAAHNGVFGWNGNRFTICDGSTAKKLAFCSEQCMDASKVTCGQPVTDICGDANAKCGIANGTLCTTAGQQCNGTACVAVQGTSCLAIKTAKNDATSGDYTIDPDGVGGEPATQVYCDMTTSSGVSATIGGWTLVMKIDGTKDTFLYDAAFWTNKLGYNSSAFTFDTVNEFKSSTFWTLPFHSVRVLMANGASGTVYAGGAQELQVDAKSLYDLFVSGAYRPTYIGRAAWKALVPNTALLYNCNLEGFNVRSQDNSASTTGRPRVRIGILTNGENDCASVDSWIGVGEQGNGCVTDAVQRASGNGCPNGCGGCDTGGSANITAFTYVFIR